MKMWGVFLVFNLLHWSYMEAGGWGEVWKYENLRCAAVINRTRAKLRKSLAGFEPSTHHLSLPTPPPPSVNVHPYFNQKASALHFLNSVADFTQLVFWFYKCSADVSCVLMGSRKHSINRIQAVLQKAVLTASFLASLKLCWWLFGCLLVVTPKHLKYLLLLCRHSWLIKFRIGGRLLGI